MKVELGESHSKVDEVRQLERARADCETRMEAVERSKTQLEDRLQTNYPHPTEKLHQMLSSFERDFQVSNRKTNPSTNQH